MEEIQMNHPVILKMFSDERIREYAAGASRAAVVHRPACHHKGSIACWVSRSLTNPVGLGRTSSSGGSAQRSPAL
jgi:hypothetical protein